MTLLRALVFSLGMLLGLFVFAGLLHQTVVAADPEPPTAATPPTPTTPPAPPKLGDTRINPVDGVVMIYIPAGPFLMGSPDGVGDDDEHPQLTVTLDGYWIYRDDVTVDQYRKFCEDTKRQMPDAPRYGWHGNCPMTLVSWDDAIAYCSYAKVTLPTEAQWEKAARGTDGRNYPWGGVATPDDLYNGWDVKKCACLENSLDANNGFSGPHPVGSFPSGNSPYGARDIVGTEGHWCADWYNPNYYKVSSLSNPQGPAQGMPLKYYPHGARVIRGGSIINGADFYRCAKRNYIGTDDWAAKMSFRCVSPAAL